MKKVLIVILALVVVSILVVVNVQKQKKNAVDVKVESISRMDLTEIVSASGKIQPKISVDISADITGKIVEVAVEEGDRVATGDLLLRIDPTQFREVLRSSEAQYQSSLASLSEAQARLEQQNLEWKRSRALYETKDLSDRDFESARTSVKLSEAQLVSAERMVDQYAAMLEQQRDQLTKTEIRAPRSGVIVRRNADVGEIAIQSSLNIQVLMVIADLSVMEVEVEVDETEIPQVSIGQKASIEIDAFPDHDFIGRVTEIANSPLQSGGNSGVDFRVVITMDQAHEGLRPGLSATAEITTAHVEQTLALPIQALTMRTVKALEEDLEDNQARIEKAGLSAEEFRFDEGTKDIEGVMVFATGRAMFKPVSIGIAGEKHFELVSGLEGDEQIIIGPMRTVRTLHHGQKVKISKDSKDKKKQGKSGNGISVNVETD